MLELWGELATEDFGKIGHKSKAGIYYWHSKKRNLLREDTYYSTVIFSANRSEGRTPTTIASRYETLYLFIKSKPQVLGTKCAEMYHNRLPFQVKIRSLSKTMALSCHPTKEHAERLHRANPEVYTSDEHKPKLIIANLHVEMLAGFRSKEEIFFFLNAIPELAIVIPYMTIQDYLYSGKVMHLKRMIDFLLSGTEQEMKLSLDMFFKRMDEADDDEKNSVLFEVIKTLHEQFPYDCGVYSPLFLNYFVMEPGTAIFLPSSTVHAFLSGDCFEFTTNSQNIIRGGLTEWFKDIHEFLATSDFFSTSPESLAYEPSIIDKYVSSFTPPAKEFAVFKICVPAEKEYTIKERDMCSMLLVIRGSAMLEDSRIIKLGTTLFLLPYQTVNMKEHAEWLHRDYPMRYDSDEHKPKLIIALRYLEIMAGFRQRHEIVSFLSGMPELGIVIPYVIIEDYILNGEIIALKRMFYYLMSASYNEIKLSLDIFFSRMSNAASTAKARVNYNVIKKLFNQFSYDCGVYAPLFLNHIILIPGQSLYIPSGTVHTYLHGDCLEVTTRSRNILRCGLTKKFKDIDEFLNIADFNSYGVDTFLFEPISIDIFTTAYVPPAKEMQVVRICVPEDFSYTIEEKESCSIVMVNRGTAILDDFRKITFGTTLFVLPYQKLTFKVKRDITIYVVYPNPDFL